MEAWALVTGASSGIGEAFARALRRRGQRILLVARRRERLERLASELGGEEWARGLPSDLSAPDAASELREEVGRQGLTVDLLINNAGLGHTGRFEEQSPEVLRSMIAVNVRAVVELTRTFLPDMKARGRGRIINVASNAAFQPLPFMSVYGATKAFVVSFTEALAEELRGSGVELQVLCPGVTRTEFLEVAETHEGLLVTRMPMLSVEEVVEASLAGLERGRLRVVTGWANRALALAVRFAPSSLTRRVAGRLYRPGT
jgi:short-subunit dehydrogenase